jgi:anhydro-N-acetylmuramic acid kinase
MTTHTPDSPRLAIGCMTGTSLDGIDAALIESRGEGISMRVRVLEHRAWPLGELAAPLRALAEQHPMRAGEIAELSRRFGELHAACVRELAGPRRVHLVAAHGQTVFHKPPASWQMISPFPIVREMACPVVSDLRQADLAAGGQGAPITPLADWVLFRGPSLRAVVNIGGFCNATLLPACAPGTSPHDAALLDQIAGMDVCACNHVLDAVARVALGAPYDKNGEAALAGTPDAHATDELVLALAAQSRGGRSLGTGDEAMAWATSHAGRLRGPDLAASATSAIARVIARALAGTAVREVLLAGGGAKNRALVAALARETGSEVRDTSEAGVAVEVREAAEIAVLGLLAMDGVDITLPRVTGRGQSAALAGAWCFPAGHRPVACG